MAGLPVANVVEGHGLRQPGVQPIRSLVDDADMALSRIGIGDQELNRGMLLQGAQDRAKRSGLAVLRQLVR